ncbi:uncharacterized protein B0H18DRAFT_1050752 [Fomitopsis serialis]|uniref:uncharacterized protein n=1 Tax=Fomitopsis serialis TaxID=139415 RepID=UPI0020079DE6|nr:uncharacterized protein B0H18DRAFT_1050752 [Neoantrodia serialis]KAH9913110.1 hypothetical protein B0H18DRAFT_1050752 [Neoantrodia serialis]
MKLITPFVVLACVLFEVATAVPVRPTNTIYFPPREDLHKRAPGIVGSSWTSNDEITARGLAHRSEPRVDGGHGVEDVTA